MVRRAPRPLPDGFDSPDPDAAQPYERNMVAEAGSQLRSALLKLPERERETLCYRYVEGLSYEEIERLTGLPFHAVKNAIYRGKTRLRNLLTVAVRE